MQTESTLLIVDRNRNVREYLKRELASEGYHILLAENHRELSKMIHEKKPVDLVVIDPDLPDVEEKQLFRDLQSLSPRTSIVIHALALDDLNHRRFLMETSFVEKEGNSIEELKHVIAKRLHRPLSSEMASQWVEPKPRA